MDDNSTRINQDPSGFWFAFNGADSSAGFFDFFRHYIRDRAKGTLVLKGGNYIIASERGDSADIHGDDVLSFVLIEAVRREFG